MSVDNLVPLSTAAPDPTAAGCPGAGIARIVLGTVQLGIPYGRRRHDPPMPPQTAAAILAAAWDLGIRTFDTAEAYGEAPGRLAAWLDGHGVRGEAHIVTKVRLGDTKPVTTAVAGAIARFRGCASLTLLTHGAVADAEWSPFVGACEERGGEAGQSVYTPDDVRAALPLRGLRRLQAPGNVFDLRALTARGCASVPLDVRSVFLQG